MFWMMLQVIYAGLYERTSCSFLCLSLFFENIILAHLLEYLFLCYFGSFREVTCSGCKNNG